MIPVALPVTEVNSSAFNLVEWLAADGSTVTSGQKVAVAETTKAIYDVEAPAAGVLGHALAVGQSGEFQKPFAFIFADAAAYQAWKNQPVAAPVQKSGANFQATAKAAALAQSAGLDLAAIDAHGQLITLQMVEAELARRAAAAGGAALAPLPSAPGVKRIVLVGAGLGATQVLDILSHDKTVAAVAMFDDNRALWRQLQHGLPVLGGSQEMKAVFDAGGFDAAIIAVGTSVAARVKLRKLCEGFGIPLANAIDPSCRIGLHAKLGSGNIFNAFCFVGTHAVIGDNNFFSSFTSIEHHCEFGSEIATGPGCKFSGCVKVRDRVRLGTGIYVQPHVEIGADVQVASGAVIVASVPEKHAVKTKTVTTQVVPLR